MRTHFNTEIPSVDVVPQEKVARGGWRSPDLEQLHQVEELPVDVSAYWKGGQQDVRMTGTTDWKQQRDDASFSICHPPQRIWQLRPENHTVAV